MATARARPSDRSFDFLAFVLVALAAIALHHTEWMGLLNGKLLDAGFAFWRKTAPKPVERDVAVIGIDVDDLREFSEPRDFWHPHYGRLLTALAKVKPAV